ncbi:altronate dehydratase family protein [Roseibacterium sp. SDUM158016]|uniref:UxaA family hydrolase n=1 Tax=Roseicyclus sediminis TaxID=2980997 RepID=UPI0021D37436|nr:altronate dehydratase family protein [Roseibacterium sp. SDUM158016]MCU4651421.1 altronate dehydratase family protein [Roseibacterium sp. SDUM158016]
MSALADTLLLHPGDTVRIAVRRLAEGAEAGGLIARQSVPSGHKIAVRDVAEGEIVLKYGQPIGIARAHIAAGDWVHEHNLAPMPEQAGEIPETGQGKIRMAPDPAPVFQGYLRDNGRTGTRNYIGVLTSVNCSASVADFIAEEARRRGLLDAYPNVDGIVPLTHGTGCGLAPSGEGYDILERTLWGHAAHPNFAGILMVGLGCEVFRTEGMLDRYGLRDSARFRRMTIQGEGGTRATVERGLSILAEMLPTANEARRSPRPASELVLALQCGGSDAWSGVTANPALGVASDMLVAAGGTSILAETPEIFGAEAGLMRRAVSREVAEALRDRVAWWADYAARHGARFDNNPTPGNRNGGLTTISEKSLGAVAKGGQAPLSGVLRYAEPAATRGFLFMDSPGYDPVSVTGQVASGATLVAFTTGRGSAFGNQPVPSLKLATNARLMAKMGEDMDIGCGEVLEGTSLEEKGREIFERLLAVASGSSTRSEDLGYGRREFVPWQIGAVL